VVFLPAVLVSARDLAFLGLFLWQIHILSGNGLGVRRLVKSAFDSHRLAGVCRVGCHDDQCSHVQRLCMCVGVLIRRVTSLFDSAPVRRITDGLHFANGLMGRLCLRRSRTARRSTFINKNSPLIAMTVLGVLRATGFAHAHAHA